VRYTRVHPRRNRLRHEVTAARQLLALGDYPGSRPRTLTLCLGGFPDFVPRLHPDVTLRVMARCTGVVVTRHFAELTYAQRPVQVTFLGLGIGDVGVEFTVIAVQDTAASVCRDIPRDYLTQSTSNWTIIRPTTTTLHTADTVVAQFDVQTSGVYTLCWVTNERDHFIPTDSQPAGSEYNFLFVVPDVLRVQPRNGTVLSADGLDNYTLVVDAHGVSRNDTVALSRNACSDVDDLVQYPLLGRNPPLNVSVAGEYTLCLVTPRITPQRIATFSVIAVVKANLTQNAVEQYETATITIRGNGMALAHALWLVPNGQLACPTVLDGASHIVPFSAASPRATEGLRVIRARLPTETAGVFGLCYYQPSTAPQFVAPVEIIALNPRIISYNAYLSADGTNMTFDVQGRGLDRDRDALYFSQATTCDSIYNDKVFSADHTISDREPGRETNVRVVASLPDFRIRQTAATLFVCYNIQRLLSTSKIGQLAVPVVNQPPQFTLRASHFSAYSRNTPVSAGEANLFTSVTSGPRPADRNESLTFVVRVISGASLLTDPNDVVLKLLAAGRLTFSLVPRASGVINMSITAFDNGGRSNGGRDQSRTAYIHFRVYFILNTPPRFTIPGELRVAVSSLGTESTIWSIPVSNFSVGDDSDALLPPQIVRAGLANVPNGSLMLPMGSITDLTVSQGADWTAMALAITLDGRPVNYTETYTVYVYAFDDGGDWADGVSMSPLVPLLLTLVARNYPPRIQFVDGVRSVSHVVVGAANVSFPVIKSADAGLYGEKQRVSFIAEAESADRIYFTRQPTIDNNGVVSFETKNVSAYATITIRAVDDGGTFGGGTDVTEGYSIALEILLPFSVTASPAANVAFNTRVAFTVRGGLTAFPGPQVLTTRLYASAKGRNTRADSILLFTANATQFTLTAVPPGTDHLWAEVVDYHNVTRGTPSIKIQILPPLIAVSTPPPLPDPAIDVFAAMLSVWAYSGSQLTTGTATTVRTALLSSLTDILFQRTLRPEPLTEAEFVWYLTMVDRTFTPAPATAATAASSTRRQIAGSPAVRANPTTIQSAQAFVRSLVLRVPWRAFAAFDERVLSDVMDTVAQLIAHLVGETPADVRVWESMDDRDAAEGLAESRAAQRSAAFPVLDLLHLFATIDCVRLGVDASVTRASSRVAGLTTVTVRSTNEPRRAAFTSALHGTVAATLTSDTHDCLSMLVITAPNVLPLAAIRATRRGPPSPPSRRAGGTPPP
jgi:hypothetical protein